MPDRNDIYVENHGSIIAIQPASEAAKAWVDEHVSHEGWQWLGPWLCAEPRQATDLLDGAVGAGLTVDGFQPSVF